MVEVKSERWKALGLGAVLGVGITLRLLWLDQIPFGLFHSESYDALQAMGQKNLGEFAWYYPENFGREGLLINLMGATLTALGPSTWAARLPSAMLGCATLVAVLACGRELWRASSSEARVTAGLWLFLVATSFWHISISRVAFRTVLLPLSQALAVLFVLRLTRGGHWVDGLVAGAGAGLGIHGDPDHLPFLTLFSAGVAIAAIRGKIGRLGAVVTLSATAVAAAPILWVLVADPRTYFLRYGQAAPWEGPSALATLGGQLLDQLSMLLFVGDHNMRHNLAGTPTLGFLSRLGFLAMLWATAHNLYRKVRGEGFGESLGPFWVLGTWLVAGWLPAGLTLTTTPHALRGAGMLLPALGLAAMGLSWFFGQWVARLPTRTRISRLAATFVLATQLGVTTHSYFVDFDRNPDALDAFGGRHRIVAERLEELGPLTLKFLIADRWLAPKKNSNPNGDVLDHYLPLLTAGGTWEGWYGENIRLVPWNGFLQQKSQCLQYPCALVFAEGPCSTLITDRKAIATLGKIPSLGAAPAERWCENFHPY